jgi:hypothetical protein
MAGCLHSDWNSAESRGISAWSTVLNRARERGKGRLHFRMTFASGWRMRFLAASTVEVLQVESSRWPSMKYNILGRALTLGDGCLGKQSRGAEHPPDEQQWDPQITRSNGLWTVAILWQWWSWHCTSWPTGGLQLKDPSALLIWVGTPSDHALCKVSNLQAI